GYGGFRGIFVGYPPSGLPFPTDIISENDYIKIYPHNPSYPVTYSGWAYSINNYINFKNVTLATEEGSINIINDSRIISFSAYYGGLPSVVPDQSQINISHNLAYLNSTKFPDMNRQAIVTLLNLNVTNPVIEVDYARRNNFTRCLSCRIIRFSGGNVTFSVPGWSTSYLTATAYRVYDMRCLLCGDVNSDGIVTSADAMIDARIANGLIVPTLSQVECGDVNRDSRINVLDALLIARFSLGLPVTLRCR
ncbi:MAG TPA: dockerin type I repeat-containing protein, partial [Bacteroidia bacterium]|nr:dockerin type I repeat-containing protein [Bacteroidia bacterium]